MNNHTNMNHPIDHSAASQDTVILEHYGLNELNFESVKGYREKFAMTKPNHPWNGLETKEFLYKIGAWGKLRNTSKEGLTVAGLLMFSEERIITEVFPQYFLEYRESLHDTLNSCWSERFTSQDGTWSGNLYDFYFKVMEHFSKNLPVSYMKEKICRALHEALINMIVHADYYVKIIADQLISAVNDGQTLESIRRSRAYRLGQMQMDLLVNARRFIRRLCGYGK